MRVAYRATDPSTLLRLCIGVLVIATLVACSQPRDGAATATRAEIVALSLQLDPSNPLIAHAELQLNAPARVQIEYAAAGVAALQSAPGVAAEAHRIPIVRLRAATTYQIVANALDDAGEISATATGELVTGPLPIDLQRLDIETHGEPTVDLVLLDLMDNPDSLFLSIRRRGGGRPVSSQPAGAHQPADADPGGAAEAQPQPGVLGGRPHRPLLQLLHARDRPPRPIGAPADQQRRRQVGAPRPDGAVGVGGGLAHEIVTIDDTAAGGERETRVLVDSLRRWDQRTNETEELWNALTHLDLDKRVRWTGELKNWLNANSIALGPRGNYILSLSMRNEIISIAPDLQSIEWRLRGLDSTYEFEEDSDRFYFQHTAAELANGDILLFDNGRDRPESEGGEYSRALELTLNAYELTAVKVWEYRHEPELFANSRSGAYRLANGNTLINVETNTEDPPRDPGGRGGRQSPLGGAATQPFHTQRLPRVRGRHHPWRVARRPLTRA